MKRKKCSLLLEGAGTIVDVSPKLTRRIPIRKRVRIRPSNEELIGSDWQKAGDTLRQVALGAS